MHDTLTVTSEEGTFKGGAGLGVTRGSCCGSVIFGR